MPLRRLRHVVHNNRWDSSSPQCIYGCHFGNCSVGTILPLQANTSTFGGISTSVSMTYPSAGIWDAAYDGAEVMVWLSHQGAIQPVGSQVGTATLGGARSGSATWSVQSQWQNGASVAARNASHNGQMPVNGSTSGGFQASYSGTNTAPSSVRCVAA